MESNIAFLVMSYNHPDTAKEVLANTVEMYGRYGMDIYYYDSSEADDTKILVEEYIQAGARNLFFVDMRLVPVDDKAIQVLSGVGLKKHYDYVFLIKDRAYFDEATIKRLSEVAAESLYDAILLPPCHWPFDVYPQSKTEVYTDPVSLFRDYGVFTPDWEVLLLNFDTMLKCTDLYDIKARYYISDVCCSLQMSVLFEGLAKLDNPRVRVLREEEVNRCISDKSVSMWSGQILDVWGRLWPHEVDALPECYDKYKAYVKKKETMQPGLFGSPYHLYTLVREDILTKQTAAQIRDVWPELSDIPYECVEYVLDDRIDLLMNRLAVEWVTLFRTQKFPQAYHMFYTNHWIKDVYGSDVYDTLEKCFEIYVLELSQAADTDSAKLYSSDGSFEKTDIGIFFNVYSVDDAVNKYRTIRDMLHRLESDEPLDTMKDVVPYFVSQKVTSACMACVIKLECVDEEKAVAGWEQLCSEYEGREHGAVKGK